MTPPESRFIIVPPSTLTKLLEMQPEAKLAWRGSFEHVNYALRLLERGETLNSNVPPATADAAIMTVADFGSVFMSHTTIDEEVSVKVEDADNQPEVWAVIDRLEERLGIRPGGVRDLPNALDAIESALIEFLSRKADVERDESEREYACSKLLSAIIEMGIKRADIPTTLRGRTKLVCELAESYFHTHGRVNDALKNARSVLDRGSWEKEPFDAQIHSLTSYAGHFKRAQELEKQLKDRDTSIAYDETMTRLQLILKASGYAQEGLPPTLRARVWAVTEKLLQTQEALVEEAQTSAQRLTAIDVLERKVAKPVDMLLYCPQCLEQHIDAPHDGWDNPPHKVHQCQKCQYLWCPSLANTNGVAELPESKHADAVKNCDPRWRKRPPSDCQNPCCTQTTKCAECGNVKHTPWRGPNGYVCVKCMGDKYDRFEGAVEQHLKLCELYTKCELALHPALDVLAPGVKYKHRIDAVNKHHIDAVNMVANAVTATQHLLIESIKKLGAADKTADYSLQNMVSLLTKFAFDARAQRNKMADDFNKERTLCVKAMAETKAAASKVFDAESKMHEAQAALRPTRDELLTTQRRLRELEKGVAEMLGIKYEPKERYDMEEVKRRFKARVRPLAGYDELARVLDAALEQAQSGKGKERHGMSGDRWVDQKIHTIPQSQGHVGGLVYQVSKKALECEFMVRQGQFAQAFKEALGVVVYAAALAWQTSIRVREHMFDDQKGVAKTVPIKQFVAIQGSPATLLTPKEHIHIQHAPEASIGGPTGNVKYAFEGVTPVPRHGAKFKRGDEVFINDGQFKGEHHKIRTAVLMGSNSKPLSWFYRMEGLGAVEIPEEHLEETPSSDIDDSSSHDGE